MADYSQGNDENYDYLIKTTYYNHKFQAEFSRKTFRKREEKHRRKNLKIQRKYER